MGTNKVLKGWQDRPSWKSKNGKKVLRGSEPEPAAPEPVIVTFQGMTFTRPAPEPAPPAPQPPVAEEPPDPFKEMLADSIWEEASEEAPEPEEGPPEDPSPRKGRRGRKSKEEPDAEEG